MKTDNELIAEFMGMTIDHERTDGRKLWSLADLPEFCKQIDISESRIRVFYGKDLEFATSWDWLMPVVEKIEKSGAIVEIFVSLTYGCKIIDVNTSHKFINDNNGGLPFILPVYKSVVEFIKWYNQQSPNS